MPASSHRPYTTRRSTKHLRDLNGTWQLSRTLSTGVPSALALQGLNASARKAFIASPLKLWISQSNYPSQIFVKQFPTAASRLPEQTERLYPPQQLGRWGEWSLQRSGIVGDTRSRCRWVRGREQQRLLDGNLEVSSVSSKAGSSSTNLSMQSSCWKEAMGDPVVEEFLMEDVRKLGECEFLEVELEGSGWMARHVWVVDGFGCLVRRLVTWGREGDVIGKRAETRLVYEIDG